MRESARGFNFHLHVGEHPLDGLILGDRLAESLALLGVMHRGFERSLREAKRLRGDADASAIERFERDSQTLAFFSQAVFSRPATTLQQKSCPAPPRHT